MGAEFNWWLLIVGVVVGGALTWLILADSNRRERDLDDRELPAEAAWISRLLGHRGADPDTVEEVLRAHRQYLEFPPPDALVDPAELVGDETAGSGPRTGEPAARRSSDERGDEPTRA